MVKKILIVLILLLAALAVVVALQPADYRVERTIAISAPAAVVFAQVNDMHKWQDFSPWARLDPDVKNTFDGPGAGRGAIFAWAGNSKVGEGRMTIVDSRPNDLVRFRLEFIKPFASVANTEFAFKGSGNDTSVTWSMDGKNNFVGKAMCLCVNMDKMIGGDFEKGLAALKSISENAAKK